MSGQLERDRETLLARREMYGYELVEALAERIERDPRTRCDPAREPVVAARLRERLVALVEPGPVATTAALEAELLGPDALAPEVTR